MILMQLATIMLLIGTTAVGGSMLLHLAYEQHQADDHQFTPSVILLGLACVGFSICAGIHFIEPFIHEFWIYV